MSDQMPISRYIISGGHVSTFGSTMTAPIVRKSMVQSPLFDIQIAADLVEETYEKHKTADNVVKSLGPVSLPFEEIWMEWSADQGDLQYAAGVTAGTAEDDISIIFLMKMPQHEKSKIMPFVVRVHLKDDGTVMNWDCEPVADLPIELLENQDELWKALPMLALYPLLALSLINCKNVSTRESGRIQLSRSGSEKRRKIPARKIKYHTIMLPGGGTQSDGRGGHRATAIHRVRGHFKTFTAEKPLLGQHVGTYWWGWQVRGKAENGIVVSDYKVGVQ